MKNKSVNGLVSVLLSLFLIESIPYVSIGLTIYGLWLASIVLKNKETKKRDRIISIVTSVIGYVLIIGLFVIYFKNILHGAR